MFERATSRYACAIWLALLCTGCVVAPLQPSSHGAPEKRPAYESSVLEFIPAALHPAIQDGSGTTDVGQYLANAVRSGRPLRLPRGVYRVDLSRDINLVPAAGTALVGDGSGSILDVIVDTGAAATRTLFRITTSNVALRNLKIRVTRVDTAGTLVLLAPGGGASRFELEKVEVDGGVQFSGSLNWNVHVIRPIPGSDFTDLAVRECYFHRVNRTFFRTGTPDDTGTLKRLRFVGNRFADHFRTPVSLNSPFGVLDDVLIAGNTAVNNFARTTGGDTAALLALGSGTNVRVVNNHLGGIGDGIHAEERSRSLIIRDNTIELTHPSALFGIRLVDNRIAGGPSRPQDVLIDGNIVRGPGSAARRKGAGIMHVDTLRRAAARLTITGNMVLGWARGIQVAESIDSETTVVSHNQIRDSHVCIWARRPLTAIAGNSLSGCRIGLLAQSPGLFGRNRFHKVETWGASRSGKIAVTGWETMSDPADLAAGTDTTIRIAPMGSDFSGTLLLHWSHPGGSDLRVVRDIRWDGHRLLDAGRHNGHSGPVSFFGMASAGHDMVARLGNSSTAGIKGSRLQAVFNGLHTLN